MPITELNGIAYNLMLNSVDCTDKGHELRRGQNLSSVSFAGSQRKFLATHSPDVRLTA